MVTNSSLMTRRRKSNLLISSHLIAARYDDDIVVDSQAVISFIQGNPIKKIFGLSLHEITSKNRKSEEVRFGDLSNRLMV